MTLYRVLPRYPSATAKDKISTGMFSNLSARGASDGPDAALTLRETNDFHPDFRMYIKCKTILNVEI
jgi:hypothetical protein